MLRILNKSKHLHRNYRLRHSNKYRIKKLPINEIKYLTVREISKTLNTSPTKIYELIKLEVIKTKIILGSNNRKRYLIDSTQIENIKNHLNKSIRYKDGESYFYNSLYKIALFQLFQARDGSKHRLIRNELMEWGFHSNTGWLNYHDAVNKLGLTPSYSVNIARKSRAKKYVTFVLNKRNPISYNILDEVYQEIGIKNIDIDVEGNLISLKIKEKIYIDSLVKTKYNRFLLGINHSYLKKEMDLELSDLLIEKLFEEAQRLELSINDTISFIIANYFKEGH